MKRRSGSQKVAPGVAAKTLDEVFQAALEHDLREPETIKTLTRRVVAREKVLEGRRVPGKVKGASTKELLDLKPGRYVRVTLVRSPIGTRVSHRETVKALGLKKLHQTVITPAGPEIRGAIKKMSYLLDVEEFEID